MKIDLTKLKVTQSLLEGEKEIDVHALVADLIWKDCAREDIMKANFALKLLNSTGELEISQDEASYILATTSVMKYWLAKAIEDEIFPKISNAQVKEEVKELK